MKRRTFVLTSLVVIALLVGALGTASAALAQDKEATGEVWGKVCLDIGKDGQCDFGDPGLPYVTVTLQNDDHEYIDHYFTDITGRFEFTVTTRKGDDYYIVQTDLTGYASTSPNTIFVKDLDPGDRLGPYDFSDVPITPPTPSPLIGSLSARVFADYRCDCWLTPGVDSPLEGVTVTVTFPDGSFVTHETGPTGYAYFSGFDASGGVTVSVELPVGYSSCSNSPASIELTAEDFESGQVSVLFGAER